MKKAVVDRIVGGNTVVTSVGDDERKHNRTTDRFPGSARGHIMILSADLQPRLLGR